MSKQKIILLFILVIILSAVFTPLLGGLYEKLFGPVIAGFFWGPSHPEYFQGFFLGYSFLISLLFGFFGGEKKYQFLLIFLGLAFLFEIIIAGVLESVIVNFGVAVTGFLLAQLILFIRREVVKR